VTAQVYYPLITTRKPLGQDVSDHAAAIAAAAARTGVLAADQPELAVGGPGG